MKNQGKYQNIHQDLLQECLKGSRRAQFRIYRLYYKAMYNTSFRIVNQRQEAEDIMQESFLKAFTHLNEYKGDVSFGAWLKKIVINMSIDHVRKRRILFKNIDEIDSSEIAEKTEENIVTEKMSPEKIFKEAELLPDGYRIVLSLHLIEGLTHEEIAKILKIKPSTVRSQYVRAKAQLLNNLIKKYLT